MALFVELVKRDLVVNSIYTGKTIIKLKTKAPQPSPGGSLAFYHHLVAGSGS